MCWKKCSMIGSRPAAQRRESFKLRVADA
jgi:hypothetical protein